MTIFDRGYRRAVYQPTPLWSRLWPLAKLELGSLFRRKLGILLFVVCLAPVIGTLIFLLVRVGMWQFGPDQGPRDFGRGPGPAALDPTSPWFYLNPILNLSFLPGLILTSTVTARAIAKDRAAGALELYWTRSITPLVYFAGKWFGSVLLLSIPFVLGPLALWLIAVLVAPDWTVLDQTIGFVPRMLAALLGFAGALTLLAVLLSATVATSGMAMILWLFVMAGSNIGARVLRQLLREDWLLALNPWQSSRRLVEWATGLDSPFDFSPVAAAVSLSVMVLILGAIATRTMRTEQAVAG